MIKSHEDGSNDDNEFMHVCIIVLFLLIKLLYSLIHFIKLLASIYTVLFSACKFHKFYYDVFINYLLYTKSSTHLILSH